MYAMACRVSIYKQNVYYVKNVNIYNHIILYIYIYINLVINIYNVNTYRE